MRIVDSHASLSRLSGFCSRLPLPHARFYSSAPSLITRTLVPAPHVGSIWVLGLNSPANRNAISRVLLSKLGEDVKSLSDGLRFRNPPFDADPPRALVLASDVDGAFSAGADLKERASFSHHE